ncbi:MAG: DUF930 domain-containing protein [Hyphomicrobiales bacterium]|nr:DUF930 domain-containing protein [Hyphomicrobiales bacterium]
MSDFAATSDVFAPAPSRGTPRRLIVASLALHLAAFAFLVLVRPPRLPVAAGDGGIAVEIVAATPSPIAERAASPVPSLPAPPPAPTETGAPAEAAAPTPPVEAKPKTSAPSPAADGMIEAKRLLSARVLADPRSRPAREALRQFAGDDRIRQLCGFEAMEQIRAATPSLQPEQVIADALAEATGSGAAIEASGAAVLVSGRWRRLAFRCELTAGLDAVARFAFRLGPEISAAERRRHDLPLGGDLD